MGYPPKTSVVLGRLQLLMLTNWCVSLQGFVAEHRDIELLKLRNFTCSKKVPDTYFTGADSQDKIIEVISAMVRFVSDLDYCNAVRCN